jgi:hypothetical protein
MGIVLYYYWTRGVHVHTRDLLAALSGSAKTYELDLLNAVAGSRKPSHHHTINMYIFIMLDRASALSRCTILHAYSETVLNRELRIPCPKTRPICQHSLMN